MKFGTFFIFSLVAVFIPRNAITQKLPAYPYGVEQENAYRDEAGSKRATDYERHSEESDENPVARRKWYLEQRLFPTGKNFDIRAHTQREYLRYMNEYPGQRSPHGAWLFLGPTDWDILGSANNHGLGRVNSIDFHPTDTNTIFIATPNGGIWRTSDGGTSWANISPNLPLLSVIDLEVDPTNPDIIFALTGDGDPGISEYVSHSQTSVSSAGIIKTTDGGLTWYPTNLSYEHPSGKYPFKLLIHPSDPMIQFACFSDGLLRTTNGWESSLYKIVGGAVYDIEFHPTDSEIVYACGKEKIWKSVDTGFSFQEKTDPDFAILSGTHRLEIAVTENIPNMVYMIGHGWDSIPRVALFQSLDFGNDGTWVVQDTVSDLIGPYARYATAMAVRPDDFTTLVAGGINIFRSSTQGVPGSWTIIGHHPFHFDIHEFKYRGSTLFAVSDGGVYRSYNDGDSWTDLTKGLAITEVYNITGTPQNTNKYIIGAQDTGHKMRTGASQTFSQTGGTGDGMISLIDYTDQNIVYISGQYGGIAKSTDGGANYTSVGLPGDGGAWITPYIMDPVDPDIIFVGKDSIYRTTNAAASWQLVTSPAIGIGNLNVMAQGTNDRGKMYISLNNRIWRSDNVLTGLPGAVSWTEITSGLPELFITDIVVDPDDATTLYLTMSGYTAGTKVYKSTTGEADSWVNISGSIPNIPVNCIAFHNNGQDGLYIGTDIGVFYRDNTLTDWIYYSNFLPSVNVTDLYFNTANNMLAAGTYGRGLWITDAYSSCPANINITGSSSNGGTLYYAASNTITSTNDYSPDLGTEVHYKAGSYIDLMPGFLIGGVGFFDGRIGSCPGEIVEPLTTGVFPVGKYVDAPQTSSLKNGQR